LHFYILGVIIIQRQVTVMTTDPFARSRLRKIFAAVIVATLPCYCAGLVAILLAPGNPLRGVRTSTPLPSVTPIIYATQTSTLTLIPPPYTDTPTPSQTPTPTITATATDTPTITQTPTQTNTPTPSNTPFIPPTFTKTPNYTATFTPTPTSTITPTPTRTNTPQPSPTDTSTTFPTETNSTPEP
jgi:hypothetical protein